MFTRITSNGGRSYLQIMESFRNADGKPRLRVVANLGRVDQLEDGSLDALIRGLSRVAGREVQEKVKIEFQSSLSYGDGFCRKVFGLSRLFVMGQCFVGNHNG
jgi:hypothetical protein